MSINTVYRVFDALHIRMQLGVPVTLQAKADIRHTGRQCIHWDGGGGGGRENMCLRHQEMQYTQEVVAVETLQLPLIVNSTMQQTLCPII